MASYDSKLSRDDIIQKLGEHGISIDLLQGVSDALLAEILRVCESKDEGAGLDDDEQDDLVRDFAERNADTLVKCGLTPQKFSENWRSARKAGLLHKASDLIDERYLRR